MLTIHNAVLLASIITGCQQNQNVRWTTDGGETVREGTLRSIQNSMGGFLARDEDVLSLGWVRITHKSGVEDAMRISDMLPLLAAHEMVIG